MVIQKEVPHNIEAEEAVLGSMLIDPGAVFQVRSLLKASDYYIVHNGWIHLAMLAITERGEPIDIVTLCDELDNKDRLDEAGGAAYLTKLMVAVPSALNAVSYAKIVSDAAYRRQLLHHASVLAQAAYNKESAHAVASKVAHHLVNGHCPTEEVSLSTIADGAKAKVYDWAADPLKPGEVRGIPTGLRGLDKMLGGLEASLIICGASTHIGKTSFACQLAVNIAEAGFRVQYIIKEMTPEQLLFRMAGAKARIGPLQIKSGTLPDKEMEQYVNAIDHISQLPLTINGRCIGIEDAVSAAHHAANTDGLDFLIIDYLGLFVSRDADQRALKLGHASQTALSLATSLEIPILALHQIGRKPGTRANKKPVMTDLQWSGMLEQDADIVMLLYREELNANLPNGQANPKGRVMEISVPKNRLTGRSGWTKAYFGAFAEIGDLKKEEETPW